MSDPSPSAADRDDADAPCAIERDLASPLVATAVHAGHRVRPEVRDRLALSDDERLREEDPFTDRWTLVAPNRVLGTHSRFEVDLNRPRGGAVYRHPEDAWGLHVWRRPLEQEVVERSLRRWDLFHQRVGELLDEIHQRHGIVVVLDLHSYNHRRDGRDAAPADPAGNPEVNLGLSNMDLGRFRPAVDAFRDALAAGSRGDEPLDVRENVKFEGGHFSRWIHDRFPGRACSIAIEFRKSFMDEWTGAPDEARIGLLGRRLAAAVPPLLHAAGRLGA